jgi:DNA mismatch repair ATPase MutS
MSAEKVHELHRKLSEKLVEEAMLLKEKVNPGKAMKLSQEIVAIRREINSELDKLRGVKKQKAQKELEATE